MNLKTTLPYPPSVNRAWRSTTRDGKVRVYINPKVTHYRNEIYYRLVQLGRPIVGYIFPKPVALSLVVNVYPPDKRKRDLDNILKVLCDALEHAYVYENDFQITKLHVERCEVRKFGEVEIKLEAIKT